MAKDDAFKSSFINREKDLEVDKLFRACVKLEASDLHLKVGKPPMVRVDGTLRPMNRGPVDDEEMVRLCFPLMNERNRKIFERDGGADFAGGIGNAVFRPIHAVFEVLPFFLQLFPLVAGFRLQ